MLQREYDILMISSGIYNSPKLFSNLVKFIYIYILIKSSFSCTILNYSNKIYIYLNYVHTIYNVN